MSDDFDPEAAVAEAFDVQVRLLYRRAAMADRDGRYRLADLLRKQADELGRDPEEGVE